MNNNMTQEEQKELLLKDLCSRLPYGVKCKTLTKDINGNDIVYEDKEELTIYRVRRLGNEYMTIIPYLFPLSSMTEEQANELFDLFGISILDSIGGDYIKINECTGITFFLNKGFDVETHLDKLMNWLHKNNFDYRGLIPMGLAIDATGLNIY